MTQRHLAEATGLGIATINRLERGHRAARPATMVRIAEVPGCRISDVDGFREEHTPPRP
jgi:transcriptional regulator with XRE-family HTH domain